MRTYNCFTMVLSMIQIVVIFFGKGFVGKSHDLTCTGGGYQWLYHSFAGEGFILTVMVSMILQCFLIEKFLYGVPNQHGYFEEEADDFKASRGGVEMVATKN